MAKKRDKSLGDEFTQLGDSEPASPPESERSLGDQSTYGDAGDSVTDVSDLAESLQDDMEIVDLSKRYQIEGTIGKGGMGEVLRAIDTRLDRPVAIKRVLGEMARSQKALARFLTEAKSIAALNHFNIVQIYDYGRDKDGPFIIMELVEGKSLQEKLKDGPLELEAAVEMTCQLCDALSVAHEQGVIHRDIKPANILLTARSEPKLTDFGLAKQETADHGQTMAGAVLGTIDYMSPEQRRDATATDERSDLWSLAATCYQMITGNSPKVIRLDQLPSNLAPVIGKMLEEDRDKRYQTATNFRDALRASLQAPEISQALSKASADLGEGECPKCFTKNDSSRSFCRECAASLRVLCLGCSEEIPAWDKVCGKCGGKQSDLVEVRRAEMDAQQEQAESLRRELEYTQSLDIAQTIASEEDERLLHLKEWSDKFIESTKVEHAREKEKAARQYADAQEHRKAFDYSAACDAIDQIPEAMRSPEMVSQLQQSVADRDETQQLLTEIRQRVASRDTDGLWKLAVRFLELNPDHTKILQLHEQLQGRRQKREKQTAALLERAEQEYQNFNDEAVSRVLAHWPQAMTPPERVTELMKLAQTRQERATTLYEELQQGVNVKAWDGLLPKVREYLTLRPNDEWARPLQIKLQHRTKVENLRQKSRKRNKQLIIGISVLAVTVLSSGLILKQLRNSADKAAAEKAAAATVVTLIGHSGNVTSVAFSPDGKRIVSGSWDKTAKVWDAKTGQEMLTLKGHTESVTGVAFSPEGKRIVSGSSDHTVKVWDAETGQEMLTNNAGNVTSVAFSPNGKRIVSGSWGSTIKVWDAETGQEIGTLKGHAGYGNSVAFSPDGKRIVSGGRDGTVKVWNAKTGDQLLTLRGHSDQVQSVAFSPDSKQIVSGSSDNTVRLWDVEIGQEMLTLKGDSRYVTSVDFSPDGKRIVSGGSSGRLKVWDAETGQEMLTLKGHSDIVYSVAFSPDGKRMVSGSYDKTIKIWDVSPLTP